MRRPRQFFNVLLASWRRFRGGGPAAIPRRLSPEALEQALAEARLLHMRHGVDVRYLAPGEEPQMPQPADGSAPPWPAPAENGNA